MANKLLSKDGKLIGQDKTLLQAPIGGGASWGEIGGNIENQTDLINLVNSKAILHEIIYDGTNIKDTEGNVLGFADIKMLLDNPNDYVYVNDLTNHCILNYGAYEDDAIWFNSRYKIDGTNYLVRLIINWNDQLQYNVDEVPNIDKVLTKPNQAPTQNELVGIGTDNAQKRITIGDNLTLENNVLSAVGGSSRSDWSNITELFDFFDDVEVGTIDSQITLAELKRHKKIVCAFYGDNMGAYTQINIGTENIYYENNGPSMIEIEVFDDNTIKVEYVAKHTLANIGKILPKAYTSSGPFRTNLTLAIYKQFKLLKYPNLTDDLTIKFSKVSGTKTGNTYAKIYALD